MVASLEKDYQNCKELIEDREDTSTTKTTDRVALVLCRCGIYWWLTSSEKKCVYCHRKPEIDDDYK